MYTFIICLIAAIMFTIALYFSCKKDLNIIQYFLSFVIASIASVLFGILFSEIIVDEKYEYKYTYGQIKSLKDNKNNKANFIFGTGDMCGEFYYNFYYANDRGGYSLGQIDTDDAIIKEMDKCIPIVLKKHKVLVPNKYWKILNIAYDESISYILIVPKNTIENTFKLDVE